MRSLALAAALLLSALPASAQVLPFTVGDPNLQEDLEWLANQVRQNKAAIANIDTTAVASSTGTAIASTFTAVSSYVNAATTLNTCVPGSTVAYTPTNAKVDVINFGTVDQGNTGQDCALGFLVDGSFPSGFTATAGIRMDQSGFVQNASFFYPDVSVSSGVSHSFCLTVACGSSGPTINGAGGTFTTKGKFGVRDVANLGAKGDTGAAGASGSTIAVNASLVGDGSSSSPAGVNSSSVAVKNASGYVQNSELDPSSATKQGFVTLANLSGAVPSGRVDFSTITSILNTVGASTTALSASTVSIVSILNTVGQSTFTLSASTVSLFNTKASTGVNSDITKMTALTAITQPLTEVSTLTVQGNAFSVGGSSFSVAGGSATSAYQMRAGNFRADNIASGTQCLQADGSGNITGTGSSCASSSVLAVTTCAVGGITGSFTNTTFLVAMTTVTFTTTGHKVRCDLNAWANQSTAFNSIACSMLCDSGLCTVSGAPSACTNTTCGSYAVFGVGGGSEIHSLGYSMTITAPSAASHSYALTCRVGGGTGTINTAQSTPQFCCQEVP